jgi:hypothetical protein
MDSAKRFMAKKAFPGPILFIYGKDKPDWSQFHAPDYLEKVWFCLSVCLPFLFFVWRILTSRSSLPMHSLK